MGFFDRFRKGVEFVPGDVSYSNNDNFARNMVSVRTVTYSDGYIGGSYSALYRRQPAVRAVVDFLARNIGQLNPKVYERVSDTDRVEVSEHPLAVLLRNPNPVTTRYAHLRDTVADLAIYDRAYWRKLRVGRQLKVYRVAPSTITREDGGYTLANGEKLSPQQLVIFHGYSPDGDSDGVSPLETLRRVLAEEAAAVANRESMWRESTQSNGIIERPVDAPEWNAEARLQFRSDWQEKFAGSAKVPVLEEGMKWVDTQFSAPTDDYIAGRRLTYEEVAIAYGVPPVVIGMGSDTNSNAELFHRQVYQDVLGPWLRMLQDEIELQLMYEFEPLGSRTYVEFNIAEKLKGSFEEQAEVLTTSVGVPVMSPNEGRARLNLPQIDAEWANEPVRPLNVLYGGQPAPNLPVEDPGTPTGPGEMSDVVSLLVKHIDRMARRLVLEGDLGDRSRWERELARDLTPLVGDNAKAVAEALNREVYDHGPEAAKARLLTPEQGELP